VPPALPPSLTVLLEELIRCGDPIVALEDLFFRLNSPRSSTCPRCRAAAFAWPTRDRAWSSPSDCEACRTRRSTATRIHSAARAPSRAVERVAPFQRVAATSAAKSASRPLACWLARNSMMRKSASAWR